MTYIFLTLIAVSNIAWIYVSLAMSNPTAVNWVVSWFAPEGSEAGAFIPVAVVVAIALQAALVAFILWEGSKKQALKSTLKSVKSANKDLSHAAKEIEKKIGAQSKELEQIKDADARASLLATQNADLQSFNAELKNQLLNEQKQNELSQQKILKLEAKIENGGGGSWQDKLKSLIGK